MKFFTRKYFAPVMKFAVSAISSSEAIEGPRMWNTAKVIWPDLAASRKPMSRNEANAGDNRPARTSITVTDGLTELSVSKIFIWSEVVVISTISVTPTRLDRAGFEHARNNGEFNSLDGR